MTSTHPRTAVGALLAATALGALTPASAHAASGSAGFPAPFTASATAPRKAVTDLTLNAHGSVHLVEQQIRPGVLGITWEWD